LSRGRPCSSCSAKSLKFCFRVAAKELAADFDSLAFDGAGSRVLPPSNVVPRAELIRFDGASTPPCFTHLLRPTNVPFSYLLDNLSSAPISVTITRHSMTMNTMWRVFLEDLWRKRNQMPSLGL